MKMAQEIILSFCSAQTKCFSKKQMSIFQELRANVLTISFRKGFLNCGCFLSAAVWIKYGCVFAVRTIVELKIGERTSRQTNKQKNSRK